LQAILYRRIPKSDAQVQQCSDTVLHRVYTVDTIRRLPREQSVRVRLTSSQGGGGDPLREGAILGGLWARRLHDSRRSSAAQSRRRSDPVLLRPEANRLDR
jgi:hypothetical protein